MWRKIDYGTAENDDGMRVSGSGVRRVTYSSGGREIIVEVEAGERNLGVYARSIAKWSDGGSVTTNARENVLADLTQAFEALKVPIEILWM